MKKLITLMAVLFQTLAVHAQGLDTDSLRNLLTIAKADTTRIILIAQLSNEMARSDPDSAIPLALEELNHAKQIQFLKGELELTLVLAIAMSNKGDYPSAIRLLLSKIKSIDSTNDKRLKGRYNAELAGIYRDQGDFEEALKYATRNIFMIEESQRLNPQEACWNCRAAYTFPAYIYLDMHELDSAQKYIHIAFSYPPSPNLKGINAHNLATAGRIQAELNNYDSALYFFRQSIFVFKQINHTLKGLAVTYTHMASIFDEMSLRDSALFYLHQAIAVSKEKNFAKEILEADLLFSKIYEPINTDSALHYYKQAMIAKDSLYNQEKQRQISSLKFNLDFQQQEAENAQIQYKNKVRIYGLLVAALSFLIIGIVLWRNNVNKKKAYGLLQKQKQEIDSQKEKVEQTLEKLKSTQAQLIQSEKMASLGQLTAGIAHEIQNPLNFVNNFSEVSNELLDEVEVERAKSQEARDETLVSEILGEIKENLSKINHHGKRADAIVKGMLEHSRSSSGEKVLTDINALADEYLRLSYHGMRAKDKSFNADFKLILDSNLPKIKVVPQEIGRVLLNIINNAFQSCAEKRKREQGIGTGALDAPYPHTSIPYSPLITVTTKNLGNSIQISISDNGPGIPDAIKDKIFQPFFTTKPTGEGTGLGLSLSYDIVKAHGGEIKVESKIGEWTTFTIILNA